MVPAYAAPSDSVLIMHVPAGLRSASRERVISPEEARRLSQCQ